ncbi:MAG: chemotaxis protein CheV [Nitrospinae bacterium]|nr:chemotaxis protein CheV [Nitrospinota bacterium]
MGASTQNGKQQILTESGTNEVEIIEFLLGTQSFGVNVAKVREIISFDPKSITPMPEAFPSVMGMFILRDSTLPLIDLGKHLGVKRGEEDANRRRVVMVCEFNDLVNGFLVDGVNQIHRCSWADMRPLSSFISQYGPSITSSVTISKRNILLVDLEHVLVDIYPQTRLVYSEQDDPQHANNIAERHHERESAHIIIAEDSPIVRASVKRITDEVGYTNITFHDNGLSAFNEILAARNWARQESRSPREKIAAIVSDIEMPQMDGLTLCRRVKEELGVREIPIIIFSSLINEQMIKKCQSVGADAWSNKLEVADLVHILDKFALSK